MKKLAALALAASLAGPALAEDLPAGTYRLDPTHASLGFKLDHLGFSWYSASFADFDATLQLDPAHPESASLTASVDVASLTLPRPPEGFHAELTGGNWLDGAQFPQITYQSTSVEVTGETTAHVTGDLTFHGVTRPVAMDVTFNGGWAGIPPDPHARIGFSATGVLRRGDFGVTAGIPAPGSKMGVGDEVFFTIEAEFSGPDWTPPAAP